MDDAFGRALLDVLDGKDVEVIVERDDGFVWPESTRYWFGAPRRRWWPVERRAMRWVRGRVLDVGCGAGRVLVDLQERDFDVVGIDMSSGAVEACRRRGARDVRQLRLGDVDDSLGLFDTVLMLGNNLSLLAGKEKGQRLLRRLHRVTTERGRIVGDTLDPYVTEDEAHLSYHRRNRERGRQGGEIRFRIRYRDLAGPWFDYHFRSREELRGLVAGTGWRVARTLDGEGSIYVAVLEKERP